MKGLSTLIRYHGQLLDEKRRALAELQGLADRLRQQLVDLGEEMKREQAVAGTSVESSMTYHNYAVVLIERRENLEKMIADVDQQIVAATNEVADAFQELKKYEIAKANRDKRAEEEANRREQTEFDEMGLSIYRRRESGTGLG
ncbi:MAG: hypothetical protein FJX35_12380 [Alphaproteobacteria bacterium]|nr:hypothetical protein [Alphaproteobacteria bacterium]